MLWKSIDPVDKFIEEAKEALGRVSQHKQSAADAKQATRVAHVSDRPQKAKEAKAAAELAKIASGEASVAVAEARKLLKSVDDPRSKTLSTSCEMRSKQPLRH